MAPQTMGFESLLEAVPDALVGVDTSGVIRFLNHQTESMFGYQHDDLIGASLETLVPGSARQVHPAHRQANNPAPRTRPTGTDVRLSGRRADGTEFPVDIVLSPMDGGGGALVLAAMRDVTNYRKAEWDRRRLAATVEHSDDAIFSQTPEGVVTTWNPAAERIYGYSRQEMMGKSVDLLSPKDRIEETSSILARIRGGESVDHVETVRIRKDATAVTVSLTVSPIRDENDAIVGASVNARDVTEHREAVRAAQRMASIVEHSDDAIISSTLDAIITSWNPAAERLYGYASDEIIGRSTQAVTPKDRPDEIRNILSRVRAGQPVEHFETMRVRKDGTVFPASLTVSPILDTDGTVVGASVISRDVTEQMQALQAAQRLAAIVEHSDDAIISNTLDGVVATWNPAAERLFGYPSDEVIGKSAGIIMPAGYDNEIPDSLAKLKAGQPVVRLESPRVRKDGTVIPVSLTVSPIHDIHGQIVGASTIARDLSEQKRTFELARSMIEASLDSFVAISPEGKITDANEATVKLTGVPRDKLIGTSFSDYFTDPKKAEEIYQQVFTEGMAVDYPLTLRGRDGHKTLTEVLYNASVLRDERGNVVGVFAAARDVTRQVAAQRELVGQQARELDRLAELERFQRLTVGRELKMIELKREVEYLKEYGQADGGEPGDHR